MNKLGYFLEMYNEKTTIRDRSPCQTLAIIKPYIKQAGITRIADITQLDTIGLPVYTCIRPLSRSISTSQGKGLTKELAKCSAYMEAIEHYFAEIVKYDFYGNELENKEKKFITPADLESNNLKLKYDNSTYIGWKKVTNLKNHSYCYVPLDAISLDLTVNKKTSSKTSSTGLASGNNLNEAIYYGLLEVIERIYTKRFFNLTKSEKFDSIIEIKSITDDNCHLLFKKLKNNNIKVTIFNITNRLEIPTFMCLLESHDKYSNHYNYYGISSNLNSDIALQRSIVEAIQSRLTGIASSRDDIDYKTTANTSPISINTTGKPYNYQNTEFTSFNEAINKILNNDYFHNTDFYYCDLLPKNSDISVIKIISSGDIS